MKEWKLPTWTGALIGVGAAVVLTWLLRQGTQTFLSAIRIQDGGGLMAGGWLLVLGGFVLAAVLWSARLHPLITGIPAAWFLIRFAPTLVGAPVTPNWYPEWIGHYILQDLNEASFIVTGLLSAASLGEFLRRRPSQATAVKPSRPPVCRANQDGSSTEQADGYFVGGGDQDGHQPREPGPGSFLRVAWIPPPVGRLPQGASVKVSHFHRICVVALLALVGCSNATATVTTAATDSATVRLPDFDNPGQLEQAVVSFGECVEEAFPIVIRFRPDPFNGLSTAVGSLRKEDGEQVDDVVADCKGRLDLDRRLNVYQSEHPISPAERRKLVDGFVACASSVSPELSELVSETDLDSDHSVTTFVSELHPQNLTADELSGVGDCYSDMTGPKRVFSDGHPWFTP